MSLIIKICGMKEPDNLKDICRLNPDYVGFIFYPKSPRYVGEEPDIIIQKSYLPIKKTGVFVNEEVDRICELANRFHLDAIQLHGTESPEQCRILKNKGFEIIKAFSISDLEDFGKTKDYGNCCNYFLFDTKCKSVGGSGEKFDWNLLSAYNEETPFLLSGGLSEDDLSLLLDIKHPKWAGIDLNSRFEVYPGFKDKNKLEKFIFKLKDAEKNKINN